MPSKRNAAEVYGAAGYASSKRTKTDFNALPRRGGRIRTLTRSRTFSFMNLPQELRDMVYHELWQQTPSVRIERSDSNLNLIYLLYGHHWGGTTVGLPLWLLTSKAILEQGPRTVTLQYDVDMAGNEHLRHSPWHKVLTF
jgi:hypothetical protein